MAAPVSPAVPVTPVKVVTVGFEAHNAFALRQGAVRVPEVRWVPVERYEAARRPERLERELADADALLVHGVHDHEDAARIAALAARHPRLLLAPVPPNAPELARASRLERDRLVQVAEGFHHLSADNAAHGLRVLLHLLRPAAHPDPGPAARLPRGGFWHPATGFVASWAEYEEGRAARSAVERPAGRVVLTVFPAQVTSGNDAHLRDLVGRLEAEGLDVVGWVGTLDALGEEAAARVPGVDLWLNATGFTLSGTHGQPNTEGDVALLARHGTPLLGAVPLFHQTLRQWRDAPAGLTPVQVAMQIAVPELEGSTAPLVLAGRDEATDAMVPVPEHAARLARLARRTVELRHTARRDKRIAIVLFGYPPGQGAAGSAAHLDVWASLHHLLTRMRRAGYVVDGLPATAEELLELMLTDEAGGARTGVRVEESWPAAEYVREAGEEAERAARFWGRPPGDLDSDGRSVAVRGLRLGNVFVGLQPSFGYDGDPMRLLFAPDASPSHSFTAFYTWLRTRFAPHALVHFGTHGALEFMPGKQAGLAPRDWASLLAGDVPHHYLYCVNNPSEGTIAKRRSNAGLISYLTPPLDRAGLYGVLADLDEEVRATLAEEPPPAPERVAAVRSMAAEAGLDPPPDDGDPVAWLRAVQRATDEVRRTLIPLGLHRVGEGIDGEAALATLRAACDHERPEHGLASLTETLEAELTAGVPVTELPPDDPGRLAVERVLDELVRTGTAPGVPGGWAVFLADLRARLALDAETEAFLHALDGRYLHPSPGGEPSRRIEALPTGRNMHALDPQRVPTPVAWRRGRATAEAMLAACLEADGALPETVALVLWGVDNVKSGGEGIAQAFALLGVEPVAGPGGRVDRFRVIPAGELNRPRIDVVCTLSGVCRDVFPTTVELLDRAVRAVAALDEPAESNFVRAHALRQAAELDLAPRQAAFRIFSAAAGRYGAGVNHVLQESAWAEEGDLGDVYLRRMGHAWGHDLRGEQCERLLRGALSTATVTFQNIDSAETSLADVDHYYEYLGGVTAAVALAAGTRPRPLVADSYAARPAVRGLDDALALEARTRLLNPRWYEAQLAHGHQGVHHVAVRLENTFGMQATTGTVANWIFTRAAHTFLFDAALRERMARLNPGAVKRLADRLVEARDRGLWEPDEADARRLDEVADLLDDALEGVAPR
ncbi:cobaltochelatase subunit CobN [Streptomyces sp. WMMC500]|uniref:cobaltochelatase subunit CobN n=1 Tax=Streptomyces sp. WMMC500 TaxID=3015154 RepID=UPI00248B5062|nr:cobaltochelatase subunit CobN [Streptomyces sp. WMMC500]WBB61899.1 cobaltochelatase subunit CobN [Streptomyces sp. WMMC500]